MSTNSVGADCIHVTVMVAGDAFVDIYKLQTINKEFFNFCYKVDENAVIVKEKSSSLLLCPFKFLEVMFLKLYQKLNRSCTERKNCK